VQRWVRVEVIGPLRQAIEVLGGMDWERKAGLRGMLTCSALGADMGVVDTFMPLTLSVPTAS
jgi:hypothetical protein